MDMRYYEVCLRPLTVLHPFYTGSRTPLEPNALGISSIIPTTWTIAGATLNILSHHLQEAHDDLIKAVEEGSIELSGPYMLDEKLLNREPKEPRTIITPIQGIPGPLQATGSATPYFRIIQARHRPSKGVGLAILKVTRGEAILQAHLEVKAVFTERIGISLSTQTKTVIEGMMYSYRALEEIQAIGRIQVLTNIHYCITVKTEKRIPGDRAQGIIDLGGKHSIAKYIIRETSHDPFIKIDNYKEELDKPFLAVSHIYLRKIKNKNNTVLLTPGCHRIEAALGKITVLYGWDYKNDRIKDPLLVITPGSIMNLEPHNVNQVNGFRECNNDRKWYYKILTSVVKINI